jgi:hypothetical protein
MPKVKKTTQKLKGLRRLKGEGLGDYFSRAYENVKTFISPRLDDYSNTSKRTLAEYGNDPIIRLSIYRTPIQGMINTALNAVSFGKWNQLRKKYGFDQLFHLALIATVRHGTSLKNIVIEKNEVVNISTTYPTNDKTEIFEIPINTPKNNIQFTVNGLLDKTRRLIGNLNFFEYDPFTRNCQIFVRSILLANGLYSTDADQFLFQDLGQLVKELPDYVGKVAKAATTTGAVISKLTGQGKEADEVKALSRGVVNVAENVPGIGEAVKVLSKPITAVTDAFTDYVLDPIFFDTPEARKRAQVKEDWANYIAEESLRKYGQVLTPNEYRHVKHYELQQKTQAKNEKFSKGIADFERVWRDAGFNSAAEYRAAQRKNRKTRKTNDGLEGGRSILEEIEEYNKPFEGGSVNNFISELLNKRPNLTGSGKPPPFMEQLRTNNIDPNEYLTFAREKAKIMGYDPSLLKFSRSKKNKLEYNGVKFGKPSYNDHLIYLFQAKNGAITLKEANKKRKQYRARATKIRGDWKDDPQSPNNLAINILW